jgi:glyoxylase-like metal-dependent hydrolase (beta-lactamase superfamily II)
MGMRLLGPVYLVGGQDFNMVYLDWQANDCNAYLYNTGDTFLMFDCGCGESLPGILQNLRQMEFDPGDISHLFLTHAHLPHAGAAAELDRMGVQVHATPEAAAVLRESGVRTAAWQYNRRFNEVEQVVEVDDGEVVTIATTTVRARYLPGHCAGHTGWQVQHGDRRMLFCGDAVREPARRQRTNRTDFDPDAARRSLLNLLEAPPDVLYPGHGPFCLQQTRQWIGAELGKLLETG